VTEAKAASETLFLLPELNMGNGHYLRQCHNTMSLQNLHIFLKACMHPEVPDSNLGLFIDYSDPFHDFVFPIKSRGYVRIRSTEIESRSGFQLS
jgi:hypothetical protein